MAKIIIDITPCLDGSKMICQKQHKLVSVKKCRIYHILENPTRDPRVTKI